MSHLCVNTLPASWQSVNKPPCSLFTYKSVPVIFVPPCISVFAYQYNSTNVPSFPCLYVALTRSNDGQKASVLETSTIPNVKVSMVTWAQHMYEKLIFGLSLMRLIAREQCSE